MSTKFNLKRYLTAQEYFQPLPKTEELTEQELINRYDQEYKEKDLEDIKNPKKVKINPKKLYRAYVFFNGGKSEPIEGTWIQAFSSIQARKIIMDKKELGAKNIKKWESYDDSIVVGVRFIEEKKK